MVVGVQWGPTSLDDVRNSSERQRSGRSGMSEQIRGLSGARDARRRSDWSRQWSVMAERALNRGNEANPEVSALPKVCR